MIGKGKISHITADGKAVVIPGHTSKAVTFPLVIPASLEGGLRANDSVLYAMFDDNTGIVIGRMDGSGSGGQAITYSLRTVAVEEPEPCVEIVLNCDKGEASKACLHGMGSTEIEYDEADGKIHISTPYIDTALSEASENPVQNKAVSLKFKNLEESLSDSFDDLQTALNGKASTEALQNVANDLLLKADASTVRALQETVSQKADIDHTHIINDVEGLDTALSGKADSDHTHEMQDVTGLETALNNKADTDHTHGMSDVDGLENALSGKSDTDHTHDDRYYTEAEIDEKLNGKSDTDHTHDDYVKKSGDTMTGTFKIKSSSLDSTADTPTSNLYIPSISQQDANGKEVGYVQASYGTNGMIRQTIGAKRYVNESYKYNSIWADLDADGNPSYGMTSPAKFREALGILDFIYPVGSIYMSVNNTNPGTLFGGTWEAWGSGKVPVGVDNSDTDFASAEKTGGEKTHKLTTSEIPAHTHGSKSLTGSFYNVASQSSSTTVTGTGICSVGGSEGHGYAVNSKTANDRMDINATHEHSSVGGEKAHNNLQPYITCYMWKRTA